MFWHGGLIFQSTEYVAPPLVAGMLGYSRVFPVIIESCWPQGPDPQIAQSNELASRGCFGGISLPKTNFGDFPG